MKEMLYEVRCLKSNEDMILIKHFFHKIKYLNVILAILAVFIMKKHTEMRTDCNF